MKVTFYGSIALAAIAASSAKAHGHSEEDDNFDMAQYDDSANFGDNLAEADTEAGLESLADAEFGDENTEEDQWAEVDDFEDLDEPDMLTQAGGVKAKPAKAQTKTKLAAMKVASKKKIAAAKQKLQKGKEAKKTKLLKQKKVMANRKAEIKKRQRAQKNAVALKKTRMAANRRAQMKQKSNQQTKVAHEKVEKTLQVKKEAAIQRLENANKEASRLDSIAKRSKTNPNAQQQAESARKKADASKRAVDKITSQQAALKRKNNMARVKSIVVQKEQ